MSLNPLLSPRVSRAGRRRGWKCHARRVSAFASPFSDPSQGAKSAGKKPGTVPVGIELYTVRDALKADLMGTVRGVAKMGYQVVEFYSPYYDWTPQQASDVKKLLDDLGVKALSTHNSATVFTPEGIQKAIDLNQAIGSKCIVMASAGGKVDGRRGLEGGRGQAEFRRRKARAARHDRRLPQSRRRMAARGRPAADGHPGEEHEEGSRAAARSRHVRRGRRRPGRVDQRESRAHQEPALQGVVEGEGLRSAVRRGRGALGRRVQGRRIDRRRRVLSDRAGSRADPISRWPGPSSAWRTGRRCVARFGRA